MIMHIDMDAYFATLEQQWNPELRDKPIIICGKGSGERTVVATASYEAKRLGVKTAMSTWQAKKICPQAILVPAHYQKYVATTKKLIEILESFTPDVEVFSIDEAFLKIDRNQLQEIGRRYRNQKTENRFPISNIHTNFLSPLTDFDYLDLAKEIKRRIREEIGEYCTASIGIAENKLLAKIASEYQKPDGLTIVGMRLERKSGSQAPQEAESASDPMGLRSNRGYIFFRQASDLLQIIDLDAIPGIGVRVLVRLNRLGVRSVTELQKLSTFHFQLLTNEFGPSYATTLYNLCRGIDNSPLVRYRDAPEEKSFGHSYTLPKEVYTLTQAKATLLHLAEKVGERMRRKNFYGRTVHVWLRFTDMSGWGKQTTLNSPTNDGLEIYKVAESLIHDSLFLIHTNRIRAVGISCTKLTRTEQMSLLPHERKKTHIPKLLDKVNHKWGSGTLFRAETLPIFSVVEDIPDGRNRRNFLPVHTPEV